MKKTKTIAYPGFRIGSTRYSYDNGKTWTTKPRTLKTILGVSATAVEVDPVKGSITINVCVETAR